MIRKIFIALTLLCTTITASAYDFMDSDGLCYNINSDGTSVTVTYQYFSMPSYPDLRNSLTIPESVTIGNQTYSVTSIGEYAFYGCILGIVTIPNSVTEISEQAFRRCGQLMIVNISNSVTSIGTLAFSNCWSLTSITIPDSVTSIGNSAFENCTSLTSVNITDLAAWCKIDFIGPYSNPLYYAHNLYLNGNLVTDLVIPNSVTSIVASAFADCTSLTSVNITGSVTSIGASAFSGCTGLTSVTIPDAVTAIGSDAFYDTAWYNDLPDGLVYAGSVAYKYKGDMPEGTCITINDGTKGITNACFSGCSGLTSVTIPNSVTSLGNDTFSGCSGLTSITIPASVTSIGSSAFANCTNLTSVTIPDSVTSIGSSAFANCTSLTSVTIPDSVTSIENDAFKNCTGLTSVNISDLAAWCKIAFGNNPLCYAHNLYLNGNLVTDLVIPNSVTSIGNSAFSGCTSLTSVTIPNSVTSLGNEAFSDCTGLTRLDSYPNPSLMSLGTDVFKNVPTSTCVLHVASQCLSSYQSTSQWNSFTNIVDDLTLGNEDYLLYNVNSDGISATLINNVVYKSFTDSLIIPSEITFNGQTYSVTTIENGAFADCTGLTAVTIPNSVTSLGDEAFSNCTSLTSVNITDLAAWCKIDFAGSYSNPLCYAHNLYLNGNLVTDLVIPDSVTSIGNSAFSGCTGLTSVTINNLVTSIGASAFSGCTGLRSVTIGESVSSIGNATFNDCCVLGDIKSYPDAAVVEMGEDVFYHVPQNTCIIHVLPAYLETYKSTAQWNNFINIIGDLKGIAHIPAAVATAASDVNALSFVANWECVDGAASYDLYVFDCSGEEPALLDGFPVEVENGFHQVMGLQPITQYSYYVVAKDEDGNEAAKSNDIEVTTLARISAPTGLESTDITATSFVANWDGVDGAGSYDLYVGILAEGMESCTSSSTFSDKNLSVGIGELPWASTAAAYEFDGSTNARGAQWSRTSPTLTATIADASAITKVTVVASTNNDNTTIAVAVGGTAYGEAQPIASGTDNRNQEYIFTGNASGEIAVTLTNSHSVWVKSIAVEYDYPTGETLFLPLDGYPVNTEDGFYEVTELESNTTYSYYVVARDYDDIEGEQSEIVSVTPINASRGDIDGNGRIDGTDVSAVLEMALSGGELDAAQIAAADLDGNGRIDGTDVSAILEIALSGD